MKNKLIVFGMIVVILIGMWLFTSYIDSARVRNGIEPKYVIKFVSDAGNKVTYIGLGYKVIRYPSVSPNEPYKNNRGVKYGNWFMKYELEDDTKKEYQFIGTIIESGKDYIIVEPDEGTNERKSSDRISIGIDRPTSGVNDFYVVGNRVRITYNGFINESYPAQIDAFKIELVM